jgi:hypothetical protein
LLDEEDDMHATIEESTLVALSVAMGGAVPETAWLLVPDADEDTPPEGDDFDELLELRLASL